MRRNIEQPRLEMNFTSVSCHSPQKRDPTQEMTARQDKLECGWTHRIQRHFPFSKLISRKPFASPKVVVHSPRQEWWVGDPWSPLVLAEWQIWIHCQTWSWYLCVFRSQVFKLHKKPLCRRGGGI